MLRDHIKSFKPSIDRQNKFIFFGNHKVGLTSVNRFLLKNRVIFCKQNKQRYFNHVDTLTDKEIENMFKFTIVRNPFDRMVSAFFYLRNRHVIKAKNFRSFVKGAFAEKGVKINAHFHFQTPSAYYNNKKFVDAILKLENIRQGWPKIAKKIQCHRVLPKRNVTNHKHYSHYYDDKSIEIVTRIYKNDLKNFNYKF
jgi:hypothetical protein